MTDKERTLATEAALALGAGRGIDFFRNMKSQEEIQAQWNTIETRRLYQEQGRNLVEVIKARIQTLEARLKPDQELVVYCDAGRDRITVKEFEFPTWNLSVMTGVDENGNETYRIENVQDVKLTCKVLKSTKQPQHPIGFVLPPEKE
jgi:hypothetical protein